MAMAGEILGDAYVNVMAETGKLEAGLTQAFGMVRDFASNAGKVILLGIGGALATIVGTGVASVWAWAKEEQSVASLAASIRMLGGSVEALVPRYEKTISMIQQMTTIADDSTRSAMASAASMGAPVNRLDELAIAAAGLSGRMGMGMESAMRMITRAITTGSFMIFSRYIPGLREAKTAQEKLALVMDFANKGFQKQAEMANTLTGRLTQLKNNVSDLMETLGKKITEKFKLKEIVEVISKWMYGLVELLNKALDKIGGSVFDVNKIAVYLNRAVASILAVIMTIPTVWEEFKAAGMLGMIHMLLTAAKEAGYLFVSTIKLGMSVLYPIFSALGDIIAMGLIKVLKDIRIMGTRLIPKDLAEVVGMRPEQRMKLGLLQSEEQLREGSIKLRDELVQAGKNIVEAGEKYGFDTDKVKEKYKEWFDKVLDFLNTAIAGIPGLPKLEKDKWDIGKGKGERDKVEISGFADWWKKAQEAASRDKAEDAVLDTAKFTEQTATNTRDLLRAFGGITRPFLWGTT